MFCCCQVSILSSRGCYHYSNTLIAAVVHAQFIDSVSPWTVCCPCFSLLVRILDSCCCYYSLLPQSLLCHSSPDTIATFVLSCFRLLWIIFCYCYLHCVLQACAFTWLLLALVSFIQSINQSFITVATHLGCRLHLWSLWPHLPHFMVHVFMFTFMFLPSFNLNYGLWSPIL